MTELRITGFAPADPQNPTLCLQVGGEVLTIPVDLDSPPPPPAPPAPDEHGTIEVSDTFDTDTRSECMQFAMQPEDDAVPHTTCRRRPGSALSICTTTRRRARGAAQGFGTPTGGTVPPLRRLALA